MEARLSIHLAGRRFSSSSSRCRKPSKNASPSIGLTRPPLISSYRLSSISRVSDSSFKYPAIASSTSSSGARPVFAASSCRRDSVSGRRWTSMGVVYTRARDPLQNLRPRRSIPDHYLGAAGRRGWAELRWDVNGFFYCKPHWSTACEKKTATDTVRTVVAFRPCDAEY